MTGDNMVEIKRNFAKPSMIVFIVALVLLCYKC